MSTGQLRGIARPTAALRRRLGRLGIVAGTAPIHVIVENEVAVEAFARLLAETIAKCTTSDGRVDMCDVAHHVLSEMSKHQK